LGEVGTAFLAVPITIGTGEEKYKISRNFIFENPGLGGRPLGAVTILPRMVFFSGLAENY
jgi:hypothetical protein